MVIYFYISLLGIMGRSDRILETILKIRWTLDTQCIRWYSISNCSLSTSATGKQNRPHQCCCCCCCTSVVVSMLLDTQSSPFPFSSFSSRPRERKHRRVHVETNTAMKILFPTDNSTHVVLYVYSPWGRVLRSIFFLPITYTFRLMYSTRASADMKVTVILVQ